MFHLARCPRCDVVQLHKDLDRVAYRTCRACEARVPAPEWEVLHDYEAFEAAKRDLRLYVAEERVAEPGGGPAGKGLGGPPVPRAVLPLMEGGPNQRRRLADLLRNLAEAGEPLTEDELTRHLADVDCAHLRRHLLREGLVYELQGDEAPDAPRRFRVSLAALETDG